MRAMKLFMMVSVSCLMLAIAWNLVAGDLPLSRKAQAQTTAGVYSGPDIVWMGTAIENNGILAVDVDGYAWLARYPTDTTNWEMNIGGWQRGAQIFAPGTPIPSNVESLGGLKRNC